MLCSQAQLEVPAIGSHSILYFPFHVLKCLIVCTGLTFSPHCLVCFTRAWMTDVLFTESSSVPTMYKAYNRCTTKKVLRCFVSCRLLYITWFHPDLFSAYSLEAERKDLTLLFKIKYYFIFN